MCGDPYGIGADVYSFGVTLLEIGCRSFPDKLPPDRSCPMHVNMQFMHSGGISAVIRGWRPKGTEAFSENLPDVDALVRSCLRKELQERPSFKEVRDALGKAQTEAESAGNYSSVNLPSSRLAARGDHGGNKFASM